MMSDPSPSERRAARERFLQGAGARVPMTAEEAADAERLANRQAFARMAARARLRIAATPDYNDDPAEWAERDAVLAAMDAAAEEPASDEPSP